MPNTEIIFGVVIIIGLLAFLVGWAAGVLSFLFTIYESIATSRFNPKAFKYGKLVLNQTEPIQFDMERVPIDQIIKTENVKFKFIDRETCLFLKHRGWFKFDFHTPFPLKNKMRLQTDSIEIEGRLPLGTSLFLLAWLIGWTGGGLMFLGAEPNEFVKTIGFFLPGWIGGCLFILCGSL